MTIVKWQVSSYASVPDRKEYDKETECFYVYRSGRMNAARRDAKQSIYYRYFDSEQEALEFIRQRKESKDEQKRADQIKRHAVELLEALETLEAAYSKYVNWEFAGSTDPNPELSGPPATAARAAIAKAKSPTGNS